MYMFFNFGGVQPVKPMLWWKLPVLLKIKVFMWLMCKNKILTKAKLQEKGRQGDLACQICSHLEDNNYLFFQCYFAKCIWFYMGNCQDIMLNFQSMDDVVSFALTLDKHKRTAFLIVVSVVILCIWKQRNELCFNNSIVHSCRHVILTIVSIVVYWTGQLKMDLQEAVNEWLPKDLHEVPI